MRSIATVIPHGVSPHPTLSRFTGEGIGNPSPLGRETGRAQYFLVVGRVDKKKNLEVVIDAFSESRIQNPESRLIFAGPFGYQAKEIVEHAQKTIAKIRKSNIRTEVELPQPIEFLGTVTDAELASLYAGATALLHPCPVEGFGLPVIEAMAVGTPVVVADAGAAREAAGEAALRVPPYDAEAWARAMDRVSDAAVRDDLISKGRQRAAQFTWERAAQETWRVLTPS